MQYVKPGSKWTEQELELLRRRASEGCSWTKIANEIGRTEEAVSTKARALSLTDRDRIRVWTNEEDAALTEMRARGAQYKDIAEALNRNRKAVEKRIKRLGLTKPRSSPKNVETSEESTKKVWTPNTNDKLELVLIWNAANQRVRNRIDTAQGT